ncbi:UbiA family prenyltransferase [Myxosarcina sp. GI1]|uniref:UbiA family prenyltransferase n=1 Tax=Myxosarcina sp. GI1 TaxID=1541065 RepID=UPI00055A8387|nr:UbiA family prenyltransferase [Myxosarcina sp. GI1]
MKTALLEKDTNLQTWLYDRFVRLIIYPSVWVSAAIASLGIFAQILMGLEFNWKPIALIFATGLIPYNLDRIFDSYVQEIPEAEAQSFFRQPYIFLLLIAAIIATAVLLYDAPLIVRYVSCAGIVPLLYGTPLFPWRRNSQIRWYRLKDIPGSKAWIVGGTLTYAAVALPLAYAGRQFDTMAALTTLFTFVFIVSNSHTFDLRDIESDRHKGVTTLPLIVGVRGTRIVLTTLNVVMLLVMFAAWRTNTFNYYPEIVLSTEITIGYIWIVKPEMSRALYNIWIDGVLFVPILFHWGLEAVSTLV